MNTTLRVLAISALGALFIWLGGCCSYPCDGSMLNINSLCVGENCIGSTELDSQELGIVSSSDISVQFYGQNFSTGQSTISGLEFSTTGEITDDSSDSFYLATVIKIIDSSSEEVLDTYYASTLFSGTQGVFKEPEAVDAWVESKILEYAFSEVELDIEVPMPTIRKANILSTDEAVVTGYALMAGTETLLSMSIETDNGVEM